MGEVAIDLSHPRDRMSEAFVAKRREILGLFVDGSQAAGSVVSMTGELHSEAAQPSLGSPVSPPASAELGGVDNVGDRG